MTMELHRPPLSRLLKVEEIGGEKSEEIEATEAEMAEIARLLDLSALTGLKFAYRLSHAGGERLRLAGTLRAAVTQACVVSLEPVETELELPVEAEFWPETLIAELERKAEDPVHSALLDWPEPIKDGKIDLGPLIYETLATGLDPYPKRADASFEWSQPTAGTNAPSGGGPFAALADLKRH